MPRVSTATHSRMAKVPSIDPSLDYSANVSRTFLATKILRLLNSCVLPHIHSDTRCNVSAHASHLVAMLFRIHISLCCWPQRSGWSSARSCKPESRAVGGQDEGQACGLGASDEQIKEYVWATPQSGQVVPGYGHLFFAKQILATRAKLSLL
ncbi:hypothetical protein BASA60_001640 [Batrachochytrium salamandrivorans]|nr:hypothetical protein BASA60_001640 [Batrachochytrium salamandrivorans]